jgi:hypothetical protein
VPSTLAAYGSGEVEAYNNDSPVIVGHNVLRDVIDARWNVAGTQTDTDVTSSGSPARRAWDGRLTRSTNFLGTETTIYFNIRIPPSTIDTSLVVFGAGFVSSTITIQIADDAAFTTNVITFDGPLLQQTGCRIVRSYLGSRYDDVEYVRIRFVNDVGSFINSPQIVEWFLGRGRVMSQWWSFGDDASPLRSSVVDNKTIQGDRSRYPHYHSRHVASHSQTLSRNANIALDDVATVRTLLTESRSFTRPILYIPRPASDLSRAMVGFPRDGLDLAQNSFETYGYDFEFLEQPPFYENETCIEPDVVVEFIERAVSFFGPSAEVTGAGFNTDGWGPLSRTTLTGSGNTPVLSSASQLAGAPRQEVLSTGNAGLRPTAATDVFGLIGSGTAPEVGGFDLLIRFGLASDPGSWRSLVGLNETGVLFDIAAQEPTALTGLEFVALGFPSTDSIGGNWHLYHSDGGGSVSDLDTGIARNTTSVFQLRMSSDPGSNTVVINLIDTVSGGEYNVTITSVMPAAATPLYFVTSHTHTSASSVGLALVGAWMF